MFISLVKSGSVNLWCSLRWCSTNISRVTVKGMWCWLWIFYSHALRCFQSPIACWHLSVPNTRRWLN